MKFRSEKIRDILARTDGWVDPFRVKSYSLIFFFMFYGLWLFWIFSGTGMLDRKGTIIGSDFLTVYAGSIFAHGPDPGKAYGLEAFAAVQNQVAGIEVKPLMWRYPPPAFILFWPLCFLPYFPACFLWLLLTALAFYRVIYALVPRKLTALVFLSYAGFYQSWIQGQNAFFTGALLCGGLLRSGTHPVQGGLLLGLLVYKPQFAVLAVLFLLVRREWMAFLAASLSGLLVILLSLAVYGMQPWLDFRESIPLTMLAIQGGFDPIHKLITFFGALVLVGISPDTARVLGGVFSGAVLICCLVFWMRCKDRLAGSAVAICGTLLFTPYAYDYEFAILAFPLAWLISKNQKTGWPVGDKTFCVLAWISPFLIPPLAFVTHVQLGFLVPATLLFLIWKGSVSGKFSERTERNA